MVCVERGLRILCWSCYILSPQRELKSSSCSSKTLQKTKTKQLLPILDEPNKKVKPEEESFICLTPWISLGCGEKKFMNSYIVLTCFLTRKDDVS